MRERLNGEEGLVTALLWLLLHLLMRERICTRFLGVHSTRTTTVSELTVVTERINTILSIAN